jgi:hypothetical protein
MARLLSNDDNMFDGLFGVVYLVANDLCEMGLSLIDLRGCSFALWPVSNQNDLDLLSTERQETWHLRFT